jgi:dihydroorotase-like cyclic amidohydrolase
MRLDLVIRGATVVTPGRTEAADIGIAGGKSLAGYSVYDGWRVQGWPRLVLRAARSCSLTARSRPGVPV